MAKMNALAPESQNALSKLRAAALKYLPSSMVDSSINDWVSWRDSAASQKNAEIPYPSTKYSSNLEAAPNMYFNNIDPRFVNIGDTDGAEAYTSPSKGIVLSKTISDPISSLVHESSHYGDFFNKLKGLDFSNYSNKKALQSWANTHEKEVTNNFLSAAKTRYYNDDPFIVSAYTGQKAPEEVVAQMKAYEANLPAGMTLFQSPLGKEIFKNDQTKTWWLMRTQPNMTSEELYK